MATLADGAFITSINGKRCTAVPKAGASTKANTNVETKATTSATATANTVAQFTAAAMPPASSQEESSTSTTSATQTTADTASVTQATAADTTANDAAPSLQQATALPDVTSSPVQTDIAAPLFTTIGTAPGSSDGAAAAEATGSSSSTNGAVSPLPVASNNNAIQSTVAVAGGVIGGVLLISMVAFFGWWWRRRNAKKRRSTLLTPLTIDNNNSFGPDEKGEYVINRGSIGPTPRAERFKAALGYNMRKINGSISRIVARGGSRGSTAPSVNMNRGNSQFMEPTAAGANRPGSAAAAGNGTQVGAKDRLMDWWSRVTADISFDWRLKNRKNPNSDDLFGSPRGMNEKTAGGNGPPGTAPDFLTLLGMDDRELDREAQRRRMSPSRQNGGSASSSDRFLGGLDLNFGASSDNNDPFSDANAIAHISAKPAPLVVSQNNNPFSDANAVPSLPKPGTYVAEMRRSRGQSVGLGGAGAGAQRPPSSAVGYRESGASVESFGTRRNKFRSDPFDLERPELLGRPGASMSSSAGATVGSDSRASGGVGAGEVRRPAGAHTRADSFTSKYSSGISMGDWSDPGPDVGPAAARGGWEGPEQRESPTQGWRTRLEREGAAKRDRRTSGGSQGSVGKAM
ncbi:hypothetical protein NKR19_g7801 [Coniochaeta hoffmannii]|uniref:Uncharacterized protein n=1 Tax=Coniochaeta hoffmannii TaxID=91930 RepID=A0AA38R914_9PEZI|nr:hypothetical protein NKR19_g7801 [Coniochaeta hoffmannii]